jgi:hypothetical protein
MLRPATVQAHSRPARSQGPAEAADEEAVDSSEVAGAIAEAARGLRFGSIEVVVHEGRVVQVVRTEKRRVLR